MENLTIHLKPLGCSKDTADTCHAQHPNIAGHLAVVRHPTTGKTIGYVKLYVLDKAAMEKVALGRMWDECREYDELHVGAKLNKIENWLMNENFSSYGEAKLLAAESILFIDVVTLEPEFRGRDLGHTAVRKTIEELRLPKRTVAMLQAGSVGNTGPSDRDAGEKLTAHWMRLGFGVYSDTDEAWLCLALDD